MSERPDSSGASAGALLLACVLLCTGIGLGVGALAGAPVPLAILGVFAGGILGFALVYSRFKNL